MSKAKTRRIVGKRIKKTKTGKLLRKVAGVSHLNRTHTTKATLRSRRKTEVKKGQSKRVRKMI